jgi:hypothetical protein
MRNHSGCNLTVLELRMDVWEFFTLVSFCIYWKFSKIES